MLYTVLRKVNFEGKITIIDSKNNIHEFGSGDTLVKIKFTTKSIEKKLFRNPGLHLGEGYMNEEILVQEGTIEKLIDAVTSCYDEFVLNNKMYKIYENFSGYFKVFQQLFR